MRHVAALSALQADLRIVKGGGGRSDRDDGQAAQQPEQIQYKHIENSFHPVPERVLLIEKSFHSNPPFLMRP